MSYPQAVVFRNLLMDRPLDFDELSRELLGKVLSHGQQVLKDGVPVETEAEALAITRANVSAVTSRAATGLVYHVGPISGGPPDCQREMVGASIFPSRHNAGGRSAARRIRCGKRISKRIASQWSQSISKSLVGRLNDQCRRSLERRPA